MLHQWSHQTSNISGPPLTPAPNPAKRPIPSSCTWAHHASTTALACALAACGGGGDDATNGSGSLFAVEGVTAAGGLPSVVCIDGIVYYDPASDKGTAIANTLAAYYKFVTYRAYASNHESCRDRFSTLGALLSVDEYNSKIVPAVPNSAPPSPSPAPTPSPGPSPSPAPAPAPAPITPRSCNATSGPGTGGLQLFGQFSFNNLPLTASSSGTVTVDAGEVSFSHPSLTPGSSTGSLRASLWAVAGSYNGGSISGTVVARYPINFTDGSNQLRNGQSSNLLAQTVPATTPARGSYCMVITLEQYDSANCSTSDRYCLVDWSQFPGSTQFQ
jgi:hypothetical protein